MTPAASTAAGRRAATARAARPPRRVSGPVGGRVARPSAPRMARPAPAPRLSLVRPVVARVRALPDASLIDRLVRGRAWIPVLGVMLAGIVAMQVEILKLGSSMGTWIERSSALSVRNQQLRATVAALADDQRIESLAASVGMVMPAPTTLGFLSVHRGGVTAALAHIRPPNPAQFLATLPVATPAMAPTASPSSSQSASSGQTTTATTTAPSAPAPTQTTAAGGQSTPQAAAASGQSAPAAGQTTTTTAASPGGAAIAPPGPTSQPSGG